MPLVIPNTTSQSDYEQATTFGGSGAYTSGFITISGGALARVRLYYGAQGAANYSDDIILAPGTYPLSGTQKQPIAGLAVRDFVDGNHVQFSGALFMPWEAAVAAGAPSAAQISAAGVVTINAVSDWTDLSSYGTFAYVSADGPTYVLSTPVDLTGVLGAGSRFKLVQGGVTRYFIVTAVTAAQLTLYGGTDYTLLNQAVSSPNYSTARAPLGFPLDPAKWTETLRDAVQRTQASPVSGTWYNLGALSLSVPIGCWRVDYEACAFVNGGNGAGDEETSQAVTLSTGNVSESDLDWTSRILVEASIAVAANLTLETSLSRRKTITVAAKTSYFLNAKTTDTGVSNIQYRGNFSPTIVRAECAYL